MKLIKKNDKLVNQLEDAQTWKDVSDIAKATPSIVLEECVAVYQQAKEWSLTTMRADFILSVLEVELKNRKPCGDCGNEQCRHC